MACSQHPVRKKTTWKDGLGGCNQAPTPYLARDSRRGKREREDPPQICERGWDGNANHGEYTSMCQVGISVRMSWQACLFLPSHSSSRTKHTVALLGTHGTSAAASGRADSWQLRFVFASWESWHCHFINYLWLLQGKKESNELFWGCSCKLDIHPRDSQ